MTNDAPILWKRLCTAFALIVLAEALAVQFVLATVDDTFLHHVILPVVTGAIAWKRSPRLRAWIQPPLPSVAAAIQAPIPTPVSTRAEVLAIPPQLPRVCVMGPDHAELSTRIDPLTRTRFAIGERFVLCGGRCGRAYKLGTCEHLQYRCPVDGAALR